MNEELLNALGHARFRYLKNAGSFWEIAHVGTDNTIVAITDKHLDRLLETWIRVLNQIEAAEAADELDCRDYPI